MTDKTQATAHAEITAPISADLRRIDDAGAQSAPAKQSEALRLAELLEKTAITFGESKRGSKAEAAAELRRQDAENQQLRGSLEAQRMITDRAIALGKESDTKLSATQAEAKHWRTNHDNVVARLRIFTQRPDIPKELADRLPWYRELVRLQAAEAQAAANGLHQGADAAAVAALKGLLSLVRREAPQLSGKVLGDAESAIAALQAAPAQAVPSGMWTIWEALPGYLIDHCEGDIISEEGLQRALEAMLKNPQYSMPPAAPAQEHATQLAGQAVSMSHREWRFALQEAIETMDAEIDSRGDESNVRRMKRAKAVLSTMLAAPAQAQEDARDATRLDFLIEKDAFIVWTDRDGSIRQCQLLTQDEDENYHVLSGEHRYFNTPREAIDAARAAQGGAA